MATSSCIFGDNAVLAPAGISASGVSIWPTTAPLRNVSGARHRRIDPGRQSPVLRLGWDARLLAHLRLYLARHRVSGDERRRNRCAAQEVRSVCQLPPLNIASAPRLKQGAEKVG
jgi:hypothetical protein